MSDNWTLWTYRAAPNPRSDHELGVVDGDTIDLLLDLGLSNQTVLRARLDGVDTAEKYGRRHDSEEYQRAVEQSNFVRNWLDESANAGDWPLTVRTRKDRTGKYGRLLATITDINGESLNDALIEAYPETEVR